MIAQHHLLNIQGHPVFVPLSAVDAMPSPTVPQQNLVRYPGQHSEQYPEYLVQHSWQQLFWQLLREKELSDLTIDQNGRLWVDRGFGLVELDWIDSVTRSAPALSASSGPPSAEELREFIIDLVGLGGRHIDSATPVVDVMLTAPVSARVHAVLPPLTGGGAVLSVRKSVLQASSLAELGSSFMSARQAVIVTRAIRARKNILVSGASGTGKTTFLAAMISVVPPEERVVTIEDIPELNLGRGNFVQLCARQANSEGAGRVTTAELLVEALRMRADRLILGELRGAECIELLTALNTGHDGGAASCHASSLESLPARMEAMGALTGLGAYATAKQVLGAIDLVIHLERRKGVRRVAALGEFVLRHGDAAEAQLGVRELHDAP